MANGLPFSFSLSLAPPVLPPLTPVKKASDSYEKREREREKPFELNFTKNDRLEREERNCRYNFTILSFFNIVIIYEIYYLDAGKRITSREESKVIFFLSSSSRFPIKARMPRNKRQCVPKTWDVFKSPSLSLSLYLLTLSLHLSCVSSYTWNPPPSSSSSSSFFIAGLETGYLIILDDDYSKYRKFIISEILKLDNKKGE